MKASPKQIALGGLEDPVEERAEIEAGYLWRESLFSAMRQFVESYIANGQRGYDAPAAGSVRCRCDAPQRCSGNPLSERMDNHV